MRLTYVGLPIGRLFGTLLVAMGLLMALGAGRAAADYESPQVLPSNPSSGSLPGCITVRWNHSGSGVWDFSVERQSPYWRWDNVNAAQRQLPDCGLQPNSTHSYKVCAYFITEDGDVECSDWESGTTSPPAAPQGQGRPPTPRIVEHHAGETWIGIKWEAGFDYDSYFVNFEERAAPGAPRFPVVNIHHDDDGTWGYQRVDGLRPGRTYLFVVQGCTETFFGIASDKCWDWSAVYAASTLGGAPAGSVSFESVNFPGFFIRHRNALGYITTVSSDLDRKDATWMVRPALSGTPGAVSFESINYPGTYLRHQGFRVKQHRNDGSDLFKKDASFLVRPGLADGTAQSFESVNFPGHFIRHQNYELWIAQSNGSDLFRKDATFHQRPPR